MFLANTDTTWLALFSWFWALSFSVFDWHLAMCNWYHFFCLVPVNLLSTFGTGSSTKSAVPRNIFIFNWTLDAKPFKLLRYTCRRAKAFAKFQLKSFEDVLEIAGSFFKHHIVFPLTLAYDRTTVTQQQDIWSGGIVVIQLVYYIVSTFCEVIKLDYLGLFFTIINFFAMQAFVWRSITQQYFSFLLTLFWRCKMSAKCSSSPFQNDKLH